MTTTEELRTLDSYIETLERSLNGLHNKYRKAGINLELTRARAHREALLGSGRRGDPSAGDSPATREDAV